MMDVLQLTEMLKDVHLTSQNRISLQLKQQLPVMSDSHYSALERRKRPLQPSN